MIASTWIKSDITLYSQNLVMTLVKVIRSQNPLVRLHYEREMINKREFLYSGINVNL